MSERHSNQGAKRLVRVFAFPVALSGVVACAAILGIDDRSPIDDSPDADAGGPDTGEGGDAPFVEGGVDGALDASGFDAQGNKCDATACMNANGLCMDNTCIIDCTPPKCVKGSAVLCPDDNDCRINCTATNACDMLACKGGRSCVLECSGMTSCKDTVTCTSPICIADCTGPNSCEKGVDFNATSYCRVTCSGPASCNMMGFEINCETSPDASIICGPGAKACEKAKPTCHGANCAIHCQNASTCTQDVCCEGGTCVLDPPSLMDKCP